MVRHYRLIRYEDIRDNYQYVMRMLQTEFALEKRNEKELFETVDTHCKDPTRQFVPRTIGLSDADHDFIWSNVDVSQEQLLGYHCPITLLKGEHGSCE